MVNLLKEWFISSTIVCALLGLAFFLGGKVNIFNALMIYPAFVFFYFYLYYFKLKPLYRKIGIPPFLNGHLEFNINKNDLEKILNKINKNSNYILESSQNDKIIYLRNNAEPIQYRDNKYQILPVNVEFKNHHNGDVTVNLKTNFGYSIIEHHGRYYLVQQELLHMLTEEH